MGWPYEQVESKSDDARSTTRPQHLNTGHSFGSDLGAEDERALLEYLKNL